MINPYFVLTAAHCVYYVTDASKGTTAGWSSTVWVKPARDGDTWPYGRVLAAQMTIPNGFSDAAPNGYNWDAINYDWAVGGYNERQELACGLLYGVGTNQHMQFRFSWQSN